MDSEGHAGASASEQGASASAAASVPDFSPPDAPLASSQPAALREDQIQNAVTFLSHPKVRGSTEAAKRSFLDKKGLTAAEIDEAFKRVPPEAPAAAPAAAVATSTPTVGANNLVTYTQQQQQPAVQAIQHMPQVPSQALVPVQPMHLQPQRPPVHWAQVVLGVGVAAAGVYGLHQLLAPRLSAWSQHLFSSSKAAAEAEAQRTAALTAALERLSDGQARLQETLEGLTAAVKQQQQRHHTDHHAGAYADSQVDYLACQSPSLGKRHHHQQQQAYGGGGSYYGGGGVGGPPQSVDNYASSSRGGVVRGGGAGGWDPYASDGTGMSYRAAASDGRPGSASSPSGRNATSGAGGAPSGFYGSSATGFEVTPPPQGNYRAPQPPAHAHYNNQQQQASEQYGSSSTNRPSGPSGADPGYARRTGAYGGEAAQPSTEGRQAPPQQPSDSSRPEEAPRSAAFHEVMAMVQAGITPPNVRTDIDDTPPDPSRPLSAPQMPPRAKPWEASTVSSNGYSSTPGPAYSSNNAVVPDGPSGFGVRGYGGAATAAAAMTPTSGRHGSTGSFFGADQQSAAAAAAGNGVAGDAAVPAGNNTNINSSSSSRFDAPAADKGGVGYDLSGLLGADAASRDAPWRPPPPPAATVQQTNRPTSSGSTTAAQKTQMAAAAADAAPAAAAAPVAADADMQAAAPAPPPPPPAAPGPEQAAGLAASAADGMSVGAPAPVDQGVGPSVVEAPQVEAAA